MLAAFIAERKATKGLTESGEAWLQDTLGTFLRWQPVQATQTTKAHVVSFLARYEGKPWRKHAMYRAIKSFSKWVSQTYDVPNPMLDRWGNPAIQIPKTPDVLLFTQTPDNVARLIQLAPTFREKAVISLLADSGARRSEVANTQASDLDLGQCRIRVMGKGNKEGFILFGAKTKDALQAYIADAMPTGRLFDLDTEGLKTLLRRLEDKTGIKCNAHSFRRGFATELRRQGLSELDIAELGRWSSTEMVKRYSRAYTFDDAAKRYKGILR